MKSKENEIGKEKGKKRKERKVSKVRIQQKKKGIKRKEEKK